MCQVTREELLEEEEYDDILKEVEEELEEKYGKLAAIVMPQPAKKGPANDPAGVGLVFVKFEDLVRAVRLYLLLPGRLLVYGVWAVTVAEPQVGKCSEGCRIQVNCFTLIQSRPL